MCDFHSSQKKYRLCSNMANRDTVLPRVPVLSLNTTGSSPVATSRLKKHTGPAPCLNPLPDFKLSRVWRVCCAPRSKGVHQAPGVGWLPLASSNTSRLKSPTAPSLFNRAMLSLGMTTWARSLVMREIS